MAAIELAGTTNNTAVIKAEDGTYLTFILSQDGYGMMVGTAKEMAPSLASADPGRDHLPVRANGVINQRGSVIPIIDLRMRAGRQDSEYDGESCIIFVDIHSRLVGLAVDATAEEPADMDA